MSAQLTNIHDAFFKQVLGEPELAGQFLREHLPPEVVELLGPEAPEPLPASFVDEELRQHHSDLPFRHALVDLAATPDGALSTMGRLRALLTALKYCRRPELPERLDIILAEVEALEQRDLILILTYLDKGPVALSRQKMRHVLSARADDHEETIMGWLTQPYFEDGLEQGRVQGRTEGQATWLVRMLEKRFGTLPEHLRARVVGADAQSLDAWLDRVFDAPDLQSVFADTDTVRT